MTLSPRRPLARAGALLASIAVAIGSAALADPARVEIPAAQLLQAGAQPDGLVANKHFMPEGDAAQALHAFSGALTLSPEAFAVEPALSSREVFGRDAMMFPGVTLKFFSHDGALLPLTQEIVTPDSDAANSFWNVIVQPGRVWSEPGDDGWSRASFPFALMNQMENDTHNGLATFLYKDDAVSELRFQIVQQTAPYYIAEHFTAWGQLAADYAPAELDEAAKEIAVAAEEAKLPSAPWEALEQKAGAETLAGFDGPMNPDYLVASALVLDGTLYYQASQTPTGPFPYTEQMRFGVWSMTKSVGPTLGMLRLAQKYGPEVFDEKVVDYLSVEGAHDGWKEITFGDLLNMASGLGGGTEVAEPNDIYVDYLDDSYDAWYTAPSAAVKLDEIIQKVGKYPWGPGKVARYRDRDMFTLGLAMNAYLKAKEGPDADVWTMIAEEVLKPIGVAYAPMNRTIETDGSLGAPIMAWGWYPTLDDMAKVAQLMHDRGAHDGEQLLHQAKSEALFDVSDALPQGPKNSHKYGERFYKMGYHYVAYPKPGSDELAYYPQMSGWIGNQVVLLPKDTTAIRISNAWPAPDEDQLAAGDPSSMIEIAEKLGVFDQ